jgi:hypothetical protein
MGQRVVAILLDFVALAFAALSWAVVGSGGFIVRILGARVGFRSAERLLLWLAGAVLLRLVVDRHAPLFGVSRETRSRVSADVQRHVLQPLSAVWSRVSVAPDVERFRVQLAPGAWRRLVFAALAIGFALALILRDQIAQPYSVPDHGDPLFSMWRIGWVNHQIFADPRHLFDANIFHPDRLTLTLSDPIILPALMGAPLEAIGLHPVVVYNAVLMLAFLLSGVAMYLLGERLTGSARAGFVAGLMFACYSYRFDHYSHLELQMTQWMPLGLIALHLFVVTGRLRHALALAVAGLAQLYSSMYYAVFFLVYAAVIGAGLLAIHRPNVRRLILPTAAAAIVAALISLPLVRPFVEAEPSKGTRTLDTIEQFSAQPIDYLRTQRYSVMWRDRALPAEAERALFPGLAPVVLGAIGVAPPFSGLRVVYAVALLVTLDASRGFNGFVYPYLYKWISPVRRLRAPARLGVLVGLTLSIFAGFGALRVLRYCRGRTLEWVAIALMAGVIVGDAWSALQLIPVWKSPPAIYEALPSDSNVVLAELPVLDDPGFNTRFMYFSLWHWKTMVNGYSGYIPSSYSALAPYLKEFPRRFSVDALRRTGVTHVILNCGLQFISCEETRMLMRQSPELRIVRDTQWEGGQGRAVRTEARCTVRCGSLGGVSKIDDVAVLDDVLLAFETHLAMFAADVHRSSRGERVVSNDFRADEPALNVAVDFARRQLRLRIPRDRPRAALVLADREERHVAEQIVRGANHAIEAGFRESQIGQERGRIVCVEL